MKGSRIYLCAPNEIADKTSRGFSLNGSSEISLFVVRDNDEFYAYKNRCPHTGAPLEWKPDQFLDYDSQFIQCAIHGALFEIESGYCVRGPCAGQSLQDEAIEIDGEGIYWVCKADTAPDS